jgi:hypothetical protein
VLREPPLLREPLLKLREEPEERGAADERLPPPELRTEELFGLELRPGEAFGADEREGADELLGRERDSNEPPRDWRVREVVSFERGGVETASRVRGVERVEAPRSESRDGCESNAPSLVPIDRVALGLVAPGLVAPRVAGVLVDERVSPREELGPFDRKAASSVWRRERCFSASCRARGAAKELRPSEEGWGLRASPPPAAAPTLPFIAWDFLPARSRARWSCLPTPLGAALFGTPA